MPAGFLKRLIRRVEIYTVDIEIMLALGCAHPRAVIVPYNVMADNADHAAEIAISRENREHRVIGKIGEPRVISIRKMEFREGW